MRYVAVFLVVLLLNACRKDDVPHTGPYVPAAQHGLVLIPAYYGTYHATDSVFALDSLGNAGFDHRQVVSLTGFGSTDSTFYVTMGTNWTLANYDQASHTWIGGGLWVIYAGGNFSNRRSLTFSAYPTGYDSTTQSSFTLSLTGSMALHNDTTFFTEYDENHVYYHRIYSGPHQ